MTKLTLKPTTTLSAATQAKLTALTADTVQHTDKQAGQKLMKPKGKDPLTQSSSPSQAKPSSPKQQEAKAAGQSKGKAQSHNKTKRPYPTREQQAASRERIVAAQAWLMETYPAVFDFDAPKPLKLGVSAELLTQRPASISYHQLKDALQAWAHRRTYLHSILDHDQRYDLGGQPVEVISPEHKDHARTQLALKQQRYEERQQRIAKHKERKLSQHKRDNPGDNDAITSNDPDQSS